MLRRVILAAPLAVPALAQTPWPGRGPVRLIVPFTPGGSVDGMGRVVASKLAEKLGQTFVVENRAGANGAVGGQFVANAAPDGYTLCFSASIQVMARLVMRNPGYDPMVDLVPIMRVGRGPLLLVINRSRAPTSLGELVAAVRAEPRAWNIATSSLGAAGHLATIELVRLLGVDIPIIPYRGTAPAMTDVIANNVSMIIDPILATGGPVRAGTVRALAITAERRSPAAPAVPTAAEQGFPSLDIQSWWGLWGPRGLAPEVTQRITEVLSTGMFDADIAPRVDNMGIEPAAEPAAEFARFIAADFARSEELLRLAHFQPE